MSPLHELPGSGEVEEATAWCRVYIPWSLKIVMLLESRNLNRVQTLNSFCLCSSARYFTYSSTISFIVHNLPAYKEPAKDPDLGLWPPRTESALNTFWEITEIYWKDKLHCFSHCFSQQSTYLSTTPLYMIWMLHILWAVAFLPWKCPYEGWTWEQKTLLVHDVLGCCEIWFSLSFFYLYK
jgi:hypothetical protein